MSHIRYIVGIDEAGRAPLAGAVAVGAVRIPTDFSWRAWEGVRDSKKLTALARERWFGRLAAAEKEGLLSYTVAFSSAARIDERGIVASVRDAVRRTLLSLEADPLQTLVLLDGLLAAPSRYPFQKTIVRGDDLEPVISLASIAAKVARDRRMIRLAARDPKYGFEGHKGYPTKVHYERLAEFGPCAIHRRSFLSSS